MPAHKKHPSVDQTSVRRPSAEMVSRNVVFDYNEFANVRRQVTATEQVRQTRQSHSDERVGTTAADEKVAPIPAASGTGIEQAGK